MVAVLVADSFSPAELNKRIKISEAKLVITCDGYQYGGKLLPILEKVRAADAPQSVVITYSKHLHLIEKEIDFEQFLGNEYFESVITDRNSMISLLFSSGTTKEPKAIPWTHLTPIKGATDAHFHQDVKKGDVITWTTSMGWMMGPWTIFAALINQATLALFNGSAALPAFGEFVQNAQITMLGTIPSLVKVWRKTKAVEPYNWSSLRTFSSTGEASNDEDYLYLMSLNHYKTPIIEYCGGTEIGGGYITGTVVLPAAPATFTSPTLGTAFYLLDENKKTTEKGEVFLVPPIIGLSEKLLNRNHHEEYYAHGITVKKGELLRKHGDAFEQRNIQWNDTTVSFYHSLGRTDDAMNLGGIKVSAVEIEETLQTHAAIEECAAVSVTIEKGGPEVLLIYAVLKQKDADIALLKKELQQLLSTQLNPFFRLYELIALPQLPRTASNKIMRKELRKQWLEQ
jgi:acetyl-CoA synthetase